MGYTLNVDHWDWVNPETNKVTRLRKGDDVPTEVLDQEGIDKDELLKGTRPVLLSKEDASGTRPVPAAGVAETSKAPEAQKK